MEAVMSPERRDHTAQGAVMLVFGGLAAAQPDTAQGALLLVAVWGACRFLKALFQSDPPAKP